jgi:serine phosphatase RsbU (regulator of sigma subunit)
VSGAGTETRARAHDADESARLETRGLLEKALGTRIRLEPSGHGAEGPGSAASQGWRVAADLTDEQLAAVAEMAARLLAADGEIRSLCAEVLERYEEAALVHRLSEMLASVLGEDAIAELLLLDASQVLGAASGEVWLWRGEALARVAAVPDPMASGGPDPETLAVAKSGQALLREVEEGSEATIAVPLPSPDGAPLGVLVLRGRAEGRAYRTGERKLLTTIASLASSFIRNDRLASKARQADARRREDEIARHVHRGLLPREDPRYPGLEISGGFRAAENVGGDYYGYVSMPDGSLGLAMADVSGHGVGAALYMAAAKGAIQSEARRILAPSELLRRTNELLVTDFSEGDVFATAVFLRFHPEGRRLDSCNGGHNPPLLFRAGGEIERLERGGPALGVLRGMSYLEEAWTLAPGDLLVVYTDGIVEARNARRELFGIERLIEAVRGTDGDSAHVVRERILGSLAAHTGSLPPGDDVTIVVVRVIPEERAGEAR